MIVSKHTSRGHVTYYYQIHDSAAQFIASFCFEIRPSIHKSLHRQPVVLTPNPPTPPLPLTFVPTIRTGNVSDGSVAASRLLTDI